MIKASEAKAISQIKAITSESLSRAIQQSAEMGFNIHRIFDAPLPVEVMSELLSAGYGIKEAIGPVGDKITTISW